MKNIHILPTDKPSKLWVNNLLEGKLELNEEALPFSFSQHIYITSDEEIKEGYVLNTFNNTVYKIVPDNSSREILANPTILPLYSINREHYFKIILTTDVDLIKDGVQAIEDEFLEWFVKNPSCEEVEIRKEMYIPQSNGKISDGKITHEISLDPSQNTLPYYKIIIPKEEPKQFKGRGMLHYSGKIIGGEPKQENTAEYIDRHIVEAMVEVAKQKMYSGEEVEDLIYKVCGTVARLQGITLNGNHIDTAYKQFKKK